MSGVESGDNEGAAASAWIGPDEAQRFDVSVGERGPFGAGGRPDEVLEMLGKAELRIDATGVHIAGTRKKLLGSDAKQVDIDGSAILNVSHAGNRVRFQAYLPDRRLVWIGFEAADAAQAQRIAALLPARQSENFSRQLAELREFHQRLDAATQPPLVTPALVAVNVLVFIAMAIGGAGVMVPNGEVVVRWGSNYGPYTLAGEWWRLLTSCFIHFGIVHLALNMYALYQTGSTTERLFGRGRFLALYLFAGLTGSLASMIWNPVINGAGASGAIFGVFGGLIAFTLDARNRVPRAVMTEHRNSTLLFAGYSLFYGAVHPNIDNAAHLGGLAGGFLMGWLLARPIDIESRARASATRLAATAGVAVAVLALMFAFASHPRAGVSERIAFHRYLDNFDEREPDAIAASKKAFDLAAKSPAKAGVMIAYASAEWRSLHGELQRFHLEAGSQDAKRQTLLLAYLDARARQMEALSRFDVNPEASQAAIDAAAADAERAVKALNQP
jgi:rhomboid protease GluP